MGAPRPPTEAEVTCPFTAFDVPCVATPPFQDLAHLWCDLGELCKFCVVAGVGTFDIRHVNDDRAERRRAPHHWYTIRAALCLRQ